MHLVVAHKGKKAAYRVRGFEAHSSLTPHGVNAVQIACEVVAFIAAPREFVTPVARQRHDVPYTTVHVGTIHGGTALNTCRATAHSPSRSGTPVQRSDVFRRGSLRRLLPAMRAVAPNTHIEFDHLSTLPVSTRTRARSPSSAAPA
jgi:acetylornithine deacetylase